MASPNPRRGLLALALIGIALTLILLYKGSVGDSTAGFMQHLTHDPDLDLPETATERGTVGSVASTAPVSTPQSTASAAPRSAAPESKEP